MSGNFSRKNFSARNFSEAALAQTGGGAFRHIGRFTRDELEPQEAAVTVATTEALPVSRKMRKRLAVVAKQAKPRPINDNEEEEVIMLLLAA